VQEVVEAEDLSVVRSLVGHGIGRDMHEDPQIPNYGAPGRGVTLEEGMVLAVEPMVTAGRHTVRMGDDHWAIYSQDGSLAAHFEFTIAVTSDGPRILTPWHEEPT
jgi:methionyl aminopeptidase